MKSLIVGVFALTLAGGAFAQSPKAIVHAESGQVTVGGRMVEVGGSAGAEAGDVIVVKGGKANVDYSNGCRVNVSNSYTVQDTAPAKCPALLAVGSNPSYAAAGIAAAVAVGALALSGGGDSDGPAPVPPKPSSP